MNILYIILIISILLFLSSLYFFQHTHKINTGIDHRNKLLEDKNERLYNSNKQLCNDYKKITYKIENKHKELESTEERIKDKQKQFKDIQDNISKTTETQTELSRKAFENYCELLQKEYDKEEEEYDAHIELLKESYSNLQFKLMREADECREDLDKIRATRAAAVEAQRKEEEIKKNASFYCLHLSKEEMDDVKKLERIKLDLHKPRVLSMLIWSTYFQKQLKTLSANVLGTSSTVTGIYKITNKLDNKCYIGQSTNIAKRWTDHAKAGLGIDTPVRNKLYQAMIQDGIWNFSWELLEECPKNQLNEKERFYIDLYQSKEFGYNTQSGNKKGL